MTYLDLAAILFVSVVAPSAFMWMLHLISDGEPPQEKADEF